MSANELLNDIRSAALDAVEASCPCEIKFGVVTSVKPLAVRLEQKITLSENALILPRKFTDHKIKITAGNIKDFYFLNDENFDYEKEKEEEKKEVSPPHVHALGDLEITVHGQLRIGEKLILIRQRGGQKFLIFDVVTE